MSRDLVVAFKLNGTAKNGTDYQQAPTSIIIPSGSDSVQVKIKPIDNTVKEGTRNVTIKLLASPDGSYIVGKAKKATVSILDND